MKTYIAQIINPHGNGYAIVNASNPKSVEDIIRNQSRFHNSIVASCRELVWKDADDSIIYEGAIVTLGKSAYDLAVLAGYKGTLEEWLSSMKGVAGDDGITPTITATAEVANTIGTPSVSVTNTSSNITAPNFKFSFSGIKGEPGSSSSSAINSISVNGIIISPVGGVVDIIVPTSLPANGGNSSTVNNHTVNSNVPANAVFTDTQADWTENDSTKPSFINHKPTIPDTSNFIQKSQTVGLVKNDGTIDNNTYLTQHQDISGKANTSDLSNVALSGNYYDLENKPTIPTLPTLATVATSGSYNDLSDKPTIPSSSGDENVIEEVQVNGVALTPDANKAVNVQVPPNYPLQTQTALTVQIAPNTFNVWSEPISNDLTITLGAEVSGVMNEYLMQFSIASGVTPQVTFPSNLQWTGIDTFQGGKTYQVSIVNGYAIGVEFDTITS